MTDQAIKYFRGTPEERKALWDSLEKYCEDNNLEKGWYCPYIPLQTCSSLTEPEDVITEAKKLNEFVSKQ